jgi:hypothetical protein
MMRDTNQESVKSFSLSLAYNNLSFLLFSLRLYESIENILEVVAEDVR